MAGREHGEDIQGRPQGLHGHLDSRETALQHVTFRGWDKEVVFPQQPAEADPLIVQILGHCFPPSLRRWRFFKSTEILKRKDTKSLTFPRFVFTSWEHGAVPYRGKADGWFESGLAPANPSTELGGRELGGGGSANFSMGR